VNLKSPKKFIVTTPGLSATRWLSFVLALHDDVFVAHGKHSLDSVVNGNVERERQLGDVESLTLGNKMAAFYQETPLSDVFKAYREIMPAAKAYGAVHTYTLTSLAQYQDNDELSSYQIVNLLRHPITFIDSHYAMVQSAEDHPALYKGFEAFFGEMLEACPELHRMDSPNSRQFMAFAISCYTIARLQVDFEQSIANNVHHLMMERVTTDASALKSMCETLTGLSYDEAQLSELIVKGPINRHRKQNAATDPRSIFDNWEPWQRNLAYAVIPLSVLEKLTELGYDVSMLRGLPAKYRRKTNHGHIAAFRSPPVLQQPTGDPPKLILKSFLGFNFVRYKNDIYAVSIQLGPVDLIKVTKPELDSYVCQQQLFITSSLDEAIAKVELVIKGKKFWRLSQAWLNPKKLFGAIHDRLQNAALRKTHPYLPSNEHY